MSSRRGDRDGCCRLGLPVSVEIQAQVEDISVGFASASICYS
ncbi:MAG: hypothetical protein WBB29_12655 [Geitlerinemataceae cyanobacterium]